MSKFLCIQIFKTHLTGPHISKGPWRGDVQVRAKMDMLTTNYHRFLGSKWILRRCPFFSTFQYMNVRTQDGCTHLPLKVAEGLCSEILVSTNLSATPITLQHSLWFVLFFFPFHSLILSPFRMCSNFILKGSVCHPSLCERQHSAPVSAQHLVPSLYYIVPSSMNKSIHILINTADDLLWVEKLTTYSISYFVHLSNWLSVYNSILPAIKSKIKN